MYVLAFPSDSHCSVLVHDFISKQSRTAMLFIVPVKSCNFHEIWFLLPLWYGYIHKFKSFTKWTILQDKLFCHQIKPQMNMLFSTHKYFAYKNWCFHSIYKWILPSTGINSCWLYSDQMMNILGHQIKGPFDWPLLLTRQSRWGEMILYPAVWAWFRN